MNSLLLSTSDTLGGAALAAVRLQQALARHTPVQARLLVQEKNTDNPDVTRLAEGFSGKQTALARFIGERLSYRLQEVSRDKRFAFSTATFGADVHRHPLVQAADVLHLHWINFGFLSTTGIRQLAQLQKPMLWTLHDMWAFTGGCHHSGDCERFQQRCGQCRFMKRPSAHDLSHQVWRRKQQAYAPARLFPVACSRWLAERAMQSSLLAGQTVRTIPNPLDTDLFRPIAKAEARQVLGLPENKKLLLFAAMRVDAPMKGFSFLQQMLERRAAQSPETIHDTALLVFGQIKTVDLQALPYPAYSLGLLRDPARMALAYAAADVFVTPSLEENLPYTVMEALSCGTPALGFQVGGIPEMIQHGLTGYLARYRSAEDLLAGLNFLLAPQKQQERQHLARQFVLHNYAEAVVARQYAALYAEALQTGAA